MAGLPEDEKELAGLPKVVRPFAFRTLKVGNGEPELRVVEGEK